MDNLVQTTSIDISSQRVRVNTWDVSLGLPEGVPSDNVYPVKLTEGVAIYECPTVSYGNLTTEDLGTIGGVMTENGFPFLGTILLYDEETSDLVNFTKSKPNGSFSFNGLPKSKKYFLVGINPDLTMNYAIRAHMEPT